MDDDLRERIRAQYGEGIPVSGQYRASSEPARPTRVRRMTLPPPPAAPPASTSDDYHRVFKLLQGLGLAEESYHAVTVEGEPFSKARPRFAGNGHVYNSKKQREASKQLRAFLQRTFDVPARGNVAVACLFYRSRGQRIDVDNMLKQVLDCANGVCWVDDYQVTGIVGVLERDAERPRVVIGVGAHASSMVRSLDRTRTCARCGKPFEPPHPESRQSLCSRACIATLTEPVPCEWCSTPFRRRLATQRFCGQTCRYASLHAHNRKPVDQPRAEITITPLL